MMCGNASRCIGKYLYEKALTGKTEIRLLTRSGVKTLLLHVIDHQVESVTVDMGIPTFEVPEQFAASKDPGLGTFVSMGNPHYVIFTDDVDQVAETGHTLECHPAFPQRCNIEFVTPLSSPERVFRTRVWERGSGITQACGTGACATAVAACLKGLAGRDSDIQMDGGTLHITWSESDHETEGALFLKDHVYMTGPASFVFSGEIELQTS
jgi:diaminopimelate epimerase